LLRREALHAGADGTISTSGTTGAGKPKISPEALRELMSGAKVGPPAPPQAMAQRRPWEAMDPDAPTDRAMSLRTNGYERALLRYVAGLRGTSVQQTIKSLLREAASAAADKPY